MICLENICCTLGKKEILKNLEIELIPNTINTIIAPNGMGKTTLFSIIADFYIPNAGSIRYENGFSKKDVVLLLAGDKNLYVKNTVKENVYSFSILRGLSKNEIENSIAYYKKYFPQYDSFKNELTEILSYGQKRIVALFTAIVSGVKCILLDEASEGLDMSNISVLKELLQVTKKDRIIVLASQDYSFCAEISDHIFYLNEGKIVSKNDKRSREQVVEEYKKIYV